MVVSARGTPPTTRHNPQGGLATERWRALRWPDQPNARRRVPSTRGSTSGPAETGTSRASWPPLTTLRYSGCQMLKSVMYPFLLYLNTKQGRQLDRARSSAQQIALKARHLRRSALHEIAAARGHKGISLECARRPYQPTRPQRTSASTLGACWHCASTSIPLRKPNPNPESLRSRSPRLDSRPN